MTAANVTDARANGHTNNGHKRTPDEIRLEIAQTKSAITHDLVALSERFSPEHLREGAREVIREARDEASQLIREAKEATIDSVIGVKDRAVESMKESVSEKLDLVTTQARALGNRAKHTSDLTLAFISRNPLAASLVGFGAGWLLVMLRNYRRSSRDAHRYAYHALPANARASSDDDDGFRSHASSATLAVDRAREETHAGSHQSMRRAPRQTRAFSSTKVVGVVALTVAAGLGLSLFLPIGRRPRRALLGAGERVWEGAQKSARQLAAQARSLG